MLLGDGARTVVTHPGLLRLDLQTSDVGRSVFVQPEWICCWSELEDPPRRHGRLGGILCHPLVVIPRLRVHLSFCLPTTTPLTWFKAHSSAAATILTFAYSPQHVVRQY